MGTRISANDGITTTHMSLATVEAGERFAIRHIFFDEVRKRCAVLSLHEGDVAQCRDADAGTLLIDTGGGRTVELERDWARFVEVGPAAVEDAAEGGRPPTRLG